MHLSYEHAVIRSDYLTKIIKKLPEGHVCNLKKGGKDYMRIYVSSYPDHPEYERKYFSLSSLQGTKLMPLIDHYTKISTEIDELAAYIDGCSRLKPHRVSSRLRRRSEPFALDRKFFLELKKKADSNTYPKKPGSVEHKGIVMRSKGEKLIAEHLDKLGYEYVYEPQLDLGKDIYPDFAVYIPEIDKVFFIEFMGAMGKDPNLYDAGEKFKFLARNNLIPGRDTIFLCETERGACDTSVLDAQINALIIANTEIVSEEALPAGSTATRVAV